MGQHHRDFMGAKLALFLGDRLLCLHRDDRPDITWPGHWDLPGGGRENSESPLACALRETHEEFALDIPASQIRWGRAYTNSIGRAVWFFVGWAPVAWEQRVTLGEEGQGWALMARADFAAHPRVVPQFPPRLDDYFSGVMSEEYIKPPAE